MLITVKNGFSSSKPVNWNALSINKEELKSPPSKETNLETENSGL